MKRFKILDDQETCIIFFEKEREGKNKEKRKKIASIIEQQSRNAFSLGKKLSLCFFKLGSIIMRDSYSK
jgi:hypothetical protein